MSILFIVLLVFVIGLLMITIGLVFSPYYYYAVLTFFFFCVFFLSVLVIFRVNTRKYPRNTGAEFTQVEIHKVQKMIHGAYHLFFRKEHGVWICEYNDDKICLDLQQYLFQKSFICAYVTRQLRYPWIHKKRPLADLFRYRFMLPDYQNKDLFVHFTSKKGEKKIKVVKQGVSHFNFLTQGITEALFNIVPQHSYHRLERVVMPINEEIFMQMGGKNKTSKKQK